MNEKPLREYQSRIIHDLRGAFAAGNSRVILQLPTGAGKTRIAAEIVRMARGKVSSCLLLAPRRELIYQAAEALERQGVVPGVIMAGEPRDIFADVQVASFDTLHARAIRSRRMFLPDAKLVIVDEAHLSLAESRKTILAQYPNACIVGLTATPARGDGRGLGELYQAIVSGPSIRVLVDGGFLVPLRYFAPTKPDLAKLKLNHDGDYVEAGIAERMDTPKLVGDIVENWQRIASERSTVVFCVNRAHSRNVCEAFCAAGVSAEHLDGETPADERHAILARVASGATRVLCNVYVASYGLDIPTLSCAVLARPTKNITLYLQTVGRIMRPATGKTDGIVIDHAGAVQENGFADDYVPWSLDAEKVKERKERLQKEHQEPKEIECHRCHAVFKGRRDCPSCGLVIVPPSKALPVYEAALQEVRRERAKDNREATWPEKQQFIAGLRAFAREHGYADGWIAHRYRARFGVFPNDPRVRNVPAQQYSPELRRWLISQQIRYAKRKAV